MSLTQQFRDARRFNFFDNIIPFALHLTTLQGSQIFRFGADYDLDCKLLKNKRGSGRGKNGIPCPYSGRNLRKLAWTQVTVNFNYDQKVENRGGERGEREGNWIQAVVIEGKVTPLATHKGDIVTRLKDGISPDSPEAALIGNQVAVMDESGSVQFKDDVTPRLYLRYEIIRTGDQEDRNERKMQSRSCYVIDGGVPIAEETLADYLPVIAPRTDQTDMQLTSMENIVTLSAGGKVWKKLGYVLPGIKQDGETEQLIQQKIEEVIGTLELAKQAAEAAAKAAQPATA